MATLAALLLAGAGLNTPVLAQDGYDQQQWWNPGDWFDNNSQYNLFSDRYWNNRQGNQDTGDYSFDDNWDRDSGYGYSDWWDHDSDYGYNESWDDDSNSGYSDTWDTDDTGVGTTGNYESGFESGSEE